MASSLIVPVVEVRNIREHPGAALLSIVNVLGYQMVTGLVEDPNGPIERLFVKGERDEHGRRVPWGPACGDGRQSELVRYRFRYTEGEKAVYFPADTILSDELVEKFNVRPYVGSGNRIKRTRLRGEPSFGLIVEPDDPSWEVGLNVAAHYGCQKFTPPPREKPEDFAEYDSDIDPHFVEYTDLENGWLLYGKLLPGEEVIATEKIHGVNARVGYVGQTQCVGSMTTRKDPVRGRDASIYWQVAGSDKLDSLVRFVRREMDAKVVIVFGEIFGQGVQSMHYGQKKQKGFRVFDIYVDGNYLDYDKFASFCKIENVEVAPVLYRGPFDLDKIREVSNGPSTLPGADHIREGVVVRLAKERRDPALGRVALKFVSTEFDLSKHKDKDTTDR